jgi:hypothetical protein
MEKRMTAKKSQHPVFARPAAHRLVGDQPDYLAQFLIAEYTHMADSLLRNEEQGETRATFFVTLVGIVGTVLVTGFENNAIARALHDHIRFVLTLLLAFGAVTFFRIVRRNIVTDEYLRALAGLRRCFVSQKDALGVLHYDPYTAKHPRLGGRLIGVGWVQTMALVNAGLVYGVVAGSRLEGWSAAVAAGVVAVAQIVGAQWHRWRTQVAAYKDTPLVTVTS